MKIPFFNRKKDKDITAQRPKRLPDIQAQMDWSPASLNSYLYSKYNGEKNKGDVGLIRNYEIDYTNLSRRVNEMTLVNDVAKSIIKRYTKWIVGSGLSLEYKPDQQLLKLQGINYSNDQMERTNETVEAYFRNWAKSIHSDYRGQENFNELQKVAFKSAFANGDVLTIMRYSKSKGVTVELIDSQRLINPTSKENKKENWKNGVLLSPKGEPKKFCIKSSNNNTGYVIINAKNSLGMVQAFLFKMEKHRSEDFRGLSALSGSLDKLAKLDRYLEATVGTAEERAKIVYTIEHDLDSSGEMPIRNLTKAMSGNADSDDNPVDVAGNNLANTIAATTDKTVFNMAQGSKLNMQEPKIDTDADEFYQTMLKIVASSVGIPPNVVMMMYNDSYSASRAAVNDWIHTIRVDRETFTNGFLSKVFNYWFTIENMNGLLPLQGYVNAFRDGNTYIVEAYTNVEFVGQMFPHIDPVKEVKAVREKLGPGFENVPLTTLEKAIRDLGGTDSGDIIRQSEDELRKLGYFTDEKKEK